MGLKGKERTLEREENKKGGKDQIGNAVGIRILYRKKGYLGLVSGCMRPDGVGGTVQA